MPKPRVFIDADVLFAGSASPTAQGASLVILRMAEITLLECITSEQAIIEAERNLAAKLPDKLPTFRFIVHRCLQVVSDPTIDELQPYIGHADIEDVALLVTALREGCTHLITFNTRHYYPKNLPIIILRPGDYMRTVRSWLSMLTTGDNT